MVDRLFGMGGLACRWLVALSLIMGLIVAAAVTASQATMAQQAAPATEQRFDIPAQPLIPALVAFSEAAGLQLLFDASMARDFSSPGVSGAFTPEAALKRLLAGTPLVYRFVNPTTVTLQRATVEGVGGPARLDPITVDAVLEGTLTDSYAAPDNFAATRTDTPVIDTPQSTQAVTRQALEDAGATDIADAYDYLAGITRDNNLGGVTRDRYLARGFETDNVLVNGNRSGRSTALDTANVERVEAIRGPTATLFGRADPGGLVNVVTKQPLAEPFYEAELQGGAGFFNEGSRYRDVRGTFDSGGPIDEQGRLRYRFNAAAEYEKSFRNDIDGRLFFVSPVLDLELDNRTIANLELTYQYRRFVFDRGVPFIDGEPQLPIGWYVGEGQTPNIDSNYLSGTFRIDHEINDALTARLGVYSSYNDYDGPGIQLIGLSGSQARALRLSFDTSFFVVTVQPEVVAEFATGPIGHSVLFGVDASYRRDTSNSGGSIGSPFDVFDPNFPVNAPDVNQTQMRKLTAKEVGLYIQDQIDLTDQWKLLAGLRWDAVWLDEKNEIGVPSVEYTSFDNSAFLPRVGVVYQPIQTIGLYASYSETYRAPPFGTALETDGVQLEPEEGYSVEAGVKLDALDGRLTGTLAAFLADKENVIQGDPFNPGSITNIGNVRSRGVELDLSGEVIENLSLGLSYAFTDASVRGNENPNLPDGTPVRLVPRHAASLQAAYSFTEGELRGLRVFGGIVYEGRKQTDTSATINTQIPSYVRFDLGASYEVTDNVQARLFIQNLTDEEYYTSSAGESGVFPGQPFNATLGVRVRF